jgi:c(7)-type cytochrome triheme protein
MFCFKCNKLLVATVVGLVLMLPRLAHVQERFDGEFWNSGNHYQLDGKVVPVEEDGIHDPANDAVKVLQAPVEAMEGFPRDKSGVIDWVKVLEQGLITPRCKNCHPKIFLPQKGGNPVTMSGVMQGKYCGVCHGKVAFPPSKNCGRCHSVARDSVGLR